VDPNLRANVTDAIKYWERGRIFYNLILTAVVVIHFIAGYPTSKSQLSIDFALAIFLLAVVANVAYCAAYLADLFAQASGFRDLWRQYRWIVLAIGCVFAAIITHFIAAGMFPRNT
jgi:hypothetical protein